VDTTYLGSRLRLDLVRTVMGGRTFWRRYYYPRDPSQGPLDSMSATIDNGAFAFLPRRYAVTTSRGTLDSLRLGSNWTRFSFNADLVPTVTRFPGLDSVSRQFSTLHGRTEISSTAPYSSTVYHSIGYDGTGRIRQHLGLVNAPGNIYGHDALGRLAADSFVTRLVSSCPLDVDFGFNCQSSGFRVDSVRAFGYDTLGNRTSQGGSYTTGDRLTTFDGCSYATDFDGNVASRTYASLPCPSPAVTFTWTAENQLSGYSIAGGASVSFQYDALGRLVRRDVNAVPASYFLWDGDNLLAELDGSATGKIAEYSYYPGLDNLHAIVRGAFAYHAHTDGLGNVIALTNLNKQVVRTFQYDEWGRLIGGTDTVFGDSARVRWKGALWMGPQLDLYYMRSRWYDPRTGRFLSEDPIGLDGGMNPYAYAGADPVDGSDPLGLCHKGVDHDNPLGICVYAPPPIPARTPIPWGAGPNPHAICAATTGSWDFYAPPGTEYSCFGGQLGLGDLTALERFVANITPDALVPVGKCIDRFTSTPFGVGAIVNFGVATAVGAKPFARDRIGYSSWPRTLAVSVARRFTDFTSFAGRAIRRAGRFAGRALWAVSMADGVYTLGIEAQCGLGVIR
jgi:RHS repeat-associated protein